jgi:hypothetical protein
MKRKTDMTGNRKGKRNKNMIIYDLKQKTNKERKT